MMTLTPSQQSVVVQGITIVDDSVLEGPETFTLSLGSPVGAPGGVGLGTQSTTVTIIDNESTCIYMSHNYSDDLFSYNIECVGWERLSCIVSPGVLCMVKKTYYGCI